MAPVELPRVPRALLEFDAPVDGYHGRFFVTSTPSKVNVHIEDQYQGLYIEDQYQGSLSSFSMWLTKREAYTLAARLLAAAEKLP